MVGWETQLVMIGKVLLALVLGGAVGLERAQSKKPAGFRTHMLVMGAATLLMMVGEIIIARYDYVTPGLLRLDLTRIVEAIIVGISFIGAGTIIQRQQEGLVENLTTAASILFTAAIGITIGLEQYALSLGLTILLLLVNRVFGFLQRKWRN